LRTRADLAIAWILAVAGIIVSGAVEWCWRYGPRIVMPWWIYPFPAKLPLVVGCVILLEQSRRAAAAAGLRRPSEGFLMSHGAVGALERRSLAVLVIHELVETRVLGILPLHERDFSMFIFQLPSVLFWCYGAASVIVWAEAPFRQALEELLGAARLAALGSRSSWPRPGIVAMLLVLCTGGVAAAGFHLVCGEPSPSPCLL